MGPVLGKGHICNTIIIFIFSAPKSSLPHCPFLNISSNPSLLYSPISSFQGENFLSRINILSRLHLHLSLFLTEPRSWSSILNNNNCPEKAVRKNYSETTFKDDIITEICNYRFPPTNSARQLPDASAEYQSMAFSKIKRAIPNVSAD